MSTTPLPDSRLQGNTANILKAPRTGIKEEAP